MTLMWTLFRGQWWGTVGLKTGWPVFLEVAFGCVFLVMIIFRLLTAYDGFWPLFELWLMITRVNWRKILPIIITLISKQQKHSGKKGQSSNHSRFQQVSVMIICQVECMPRAGGICSEWLFFLGVADNNLSTACDWQNLWPGKMASVDTFWGCFLDSSIFIWVFV